MKKVKLFSFALAALMLGACSSEDDLNTGGQVPAGEPGYISLSLKLPSASSTTRAYANDNFDDGIEAEYNVKNAYLLLFEGPNESNATFTQAVDLGITGNETGTNENITATYNIVKMINKPTGNDKVYAMVLVNNNDNLLLNSEGSWKLQGESLAGQTFNAVKTKAHTLNVNDLAGTNGFVMTNAPLYTKPGYTTEPSNGEVLTLTEIDTDNIFTTEAEAKANPAANIYVERAVAKVVVEGNATENIPNEEITGATISGWTLDITNKSTYLVRNTDNAWWGYKANGSEDYRFVGSNNVAVGLYRTYWAKDPNYSALDGESTFNTIVGTTPDPTGLTQKGNPAYCLENTFDVTNMLKDKITRVIVAASLTLDNEKFPDNTFYIVNNNKDKIYTRENADNVVKNLYLALPQVEKSLKANLAEGQTFDGEDLEVQYDKEAGNLKVKDIIVKEGHETKFTDGTIPADLQVNGNDDYINSVNNSCKVSCYKNGVSYYPVMIRHFDDTQTPWVNGATYDTEANYLGRYGVVRNNSYAINVNSITKIGDAEVPSVSSDPADPDESWLSVTINILSWAKRNQNVDL